MYFSADLNNCSWLVFLLPFPFLGFRVVTPSSKPECFTVLLMSRYLLYLISSSNTICGTTSIYPGVVPPTRCLCCPLFYKEIYKLQLIPCQHQLQLSPYPLFPPGLIHGMVRKMQIGSGGALFSGEPFGYPHHYTILHCIRV